MAYPGSFHRIVIQGTVYADTFNTTVSMIPAGGSPVPASTQLLADSVRDFIATWWQRGLSASAPYGLGFISAVRFTGVKVNRIDASGHYQDPLGVESVHATGVTGINSATYAPQLSIVGTLRGATPRALAGKGRQYWPPSQGMQSLDGTGRISTTVAAQYADGLEGLYNGLNDAYLARGVPCVVGIASKTRSGAFQALDTITVGRTIDTMRSRRNKITEDPQGEDFG